MVAVHGQTACWLETMQGRLRVCTVWAAQNDINMRTNMAVQTMNRAVARPCLKPFLAPHVPDWLTMAAVVYIGSCRKSVFRARKMQWVAAPGVHCLQKVQGSTGRQRYRHPVLPPLMHHPRLPSAATLCRADASLFKLHFQHLHSSPPVVPGPSGASACHKRHLQ